MKRPGKKQPERRLLNFLQLWGVVLVFVSFTSVLAAWGVNRLRDPLVMPVRVVMFDGEMRYLQRHRLEQAVAQAVDGSFFTVDLANVRAEVEQLPWVDSMSVRRFWPDTLQVRVVEQQPLARWGKDALLNQRGEIFRPNPMPALPKLTRLEGEEQDAVRISQEFQRIDRLLGTVGLELAQVRVDARQAWLLQTRSGLELNLGRKETLRRLTRFVRLYPGLSEQNRARLKRVDLRYTNGFTATWETLSELQSNRDIPAGTGMTSRLAGN